MLIQFHGVEEPLVQMEIMSILPVLDIMPVIGKQHHKLKTQVKNM